MRSGHTILVVLCLAAAQIGCGQPGPSRAEQAAAAREAELAAEAAMRAERLAALEAERLAALWSYHDTAVEGGRQISASIRSAGDVDTDGRGAKSLQLVFRDHPDWGQSSYLVLQAGDFDCTPRCVVPVVADDGQPVRMAAHRPDTDEAIALFIDDAVELWRVTTGATRVSIEFPVAIGGTRTAAFDVAGLDASRMPGWE